MPTQLKGRFNETGHLALNSTRVQAVATTDLSIVQGQGDITLNPSNWGRSTLSLSQIGYGRKLTLGTRSGNMRLNGADGSNSYGSSSRVAITTPGSLTLFAKNMHLQGNQGVNLGAMGGHLRVSGTNISGGSGTASLQALGHVRLEAVMTDVVHNATSTGWRRNLIGRVTTWTTFHDRAWRNVNAVNVNARDISIKAGNNVETFATRLSASNNLRIEAGDQALYHAVRNETNHQDTTHQRRSWIGIRLDKSTEHNTTRISTPMVSHLYATNGNLTSYSGGDQLFQGTVTSYHSRDIQAGVGERARADARIILEGVKTEVFQQGTRESNYVVWQKQLNQGSQINTLSSQPGMGYLNELTQRRDVDWQRVKLAHDQWNYKQEGLTPAGAALLAAAVA